MRKIGWRTSLHEWQTRWNKRIQQHSKQHQTTSSNKKIAVQLAKRYIDDYKKMQSEPGYADQVRMDPADFSPKKDIKGKAKETEAFENMGE